jgi:hypothetical protein
MLGIGRMADNLALLKKKIIVAKCKEMKAG